ncbi:hypothetical protein ElyMa_006354300 [Elysia marginata]|uniref:Uncharacterized protein n=1 Tax=Elysia marginata TaxID=1093978 RepID=A0AAV4HN31_9GAST|nr:hypothetical protein ElyMa_006354300 [Elysia marginata]
MRWIVNTCEKKFLKCDLYCRKTTEPRANKRDLRQVFTLQTVNKTGRLGDGWNKRHKEEEADRRRNRKKKRQTEGQTDRQKRDRQKRGQIKRKTELETVRRTGRQLEDKVRGRGGQKIDGHMRQACDCQTPEEKDFGRKRAMKTCITSKAVKAKS